MPSVQTNVWGPLKWTLYHLRPFSYPHKPTRKDRVLLATNLVSDWATLPCSLCIGNVPRNLAALGLGTEDRLPTVEELADSPYLDSPDTLFYFFFMLHNQVSKMLRKPQIPMSEYDNTKNMYAVAAAQCHPTPTQTGKESGCTAPAQGYKPCMSRVVIVPRPGQSADEFYGPAFYLDALLKR